MVKGSQNKAISGPEETKELSREERLKIQRASGGGFGTQDMETPVKEGPEDVTGKDGE